MPDLLAGTTILALDTPPEEFASVPDSFADFTTTGFEPTSPACEVTFIAPTTGRARIDIFVRADADTNGEAFDADVEVRETDGTGTLVHTPNTETGGIDKAWPTAAAANENFYGIRILDSLTPGQQYWAQLQFDVTGTTFDIQEQSLTAQPRT